MKNYRKQDWFLQMLFMMACCLFPLAACNGTSSPAETAVSNPASANPETAVLTLPDLAASALNGEPLKVVATTSIIGDVVAQVGGDTIDLTTLMNAGQDPHSYEPGAQELTAVADADVIFVNGWDLEEALVDDLAEIGGDVPIVAVSAGIEPLFFGANSHTHDEENGQEPSNETHAHSGVNPHVWFNISHVMQWAENVSRIFSELDPAHAETFASNAAAYQAELVALESYATAQLRQIPEDHRFLVTNHEALGYFADSYDFTIIGTIIPGMSTLAEPSANELADLISEMEKHDLCTIFTETTVSDNLAQTIAGELDGCAAVKVVKLYTGSVGPAGSDADSFIGMFRANVDAVVAGLR